ncbi:YdcF family protein [Alicyclobacillus sp. SO9]|nr:YdcF family protein [Alicyclobacillus sp. SO9]
MAQNIRLIGRSATPRKADTAIILGAYTKGFQPSIPLLARLRAGIQLYREGVVRYIIVSGGKGENETVTESSSMKRFLVLNGVDPAWIVEEQFSSDTWENLLNSQEVMKRYRFNNAVIVTSDYHLPRAIAVARQLEMDVTGFAAWSSQGEFRYAVREVIAWLAYWRNGQLSVLRALRK